jgi:hypothetical protein
MSRHTREADSPDDVMHDVMMLPMKQRDVEREINPFEHGWERRYYAALCDIRSDARAHDSVSALCRNYLEGMEWTFRYYTRGCADWKWTYANHYPPLLADLAKHIPSTASFSFLQVKPKEPIRDLVQLCYVLHRPVMRCCRRPWSARSCAANSRPNTRTTAATISNGRIASTSGSATPTCPPWICASWIKLSDTGAGTPTI